MTEKTLRERCEIKLSGMQGERRPYETDWQEILQLCAPARGMFLGQHVTQRTRRANTATRDSAGALAARQLMAGMQSGLNNQASPWFKLTTSDRDMLEFQPVKEWIAAVERVLYDFFAATNFYQAAQVGYLELGTVGAEACIMLEHPEYKGVCHPLTAGEYWLATDDGLRTDTLYRKTHLTVAQMVSAFPWDRLSLVVQQAYDNGNYANLVPVMHAIEPNRARDPDKLDARNKPYRSVMWEEGQTDKSILLRESGFDSKPFWGARWDVTSNEVYSSSSPGYYALPDLRELQLTARNRGRAKDLMTKPPMSAPSQLAGTQLRLDPGSFNFYSMMDGRAKIEPILDIGFQTVGALRDDQFELRNDVEKCFFVDLFMAISAREGVQPLNDLEAQLRESEKFTQLGPVVDRVNIEKLEVAIDRAYSICSNLNLIPPPPPDLQGQPLTVDFVSILAQAQRAAANTAIERAARFVGFLAGIFPNAAIKFDAEQAIDEFASGTGTPPKIIRSDEVVEKMREQLELQEQAERSAAMAPAAKDGANAAKLLSETDIGGGQNLLGQLVGQGMPG